MISMLMTFWGSMSVLSSRVKIYKKNAATGAVWTVSGWYKRLWQCTRMQKEDIQCELKWPQEYKVWAITVQGSGDNDRWQGAAWAAGAQERGPTSISMEQWGKDDQDVSQRAPESSHHGTVEGGGAILEEEESIVHTVYTTPWPSTPAFLSDISTLKDGTNKLSRNVNTKLPTTFYNILQDQRTFTSVCQIWFHFHGRLYLKMFKKIFRYEMDEATRLTALLLACFKNLLHES